LFIWADAIFFWAGEQGVLAGYDQKSNVVLSDSKERVYSLDEGVEEVPLGLYLVKGDMMCVAARSFPPTPHLQRWRRPPHCFFYYNRHRHMTQFLPTQKVSPRANYTLVPFSSILIGEIDEERDHAIDHSTIRADPIAPIRY
jgi:hypothetical protein